MSLHLYYDDPDLGAVEITGYVKYGLGEIRLTMTAEQGTLNSDQIIVEDPDGIFDFQGLRNFWAMEDEAEFERVYTGWVWVKDYERGSYYRTGAARQVTLQFQDVNHVLYKFVMSGNDSDRPEETDNERIDWLLGTNEAAGILDVTTYVSSSLPTDMDANPDSGYNGQYFNQVLDDCAQQSGKNYFILDVFDDPDYRIGIWYGPDAVDTFTSDATISNVLADVDNETVFWSDTAARLNKDPSRVYSGIFANYDGGWTYRSRPETIAQYAHRDTTASWPNVKTEAKANARADRMLLALAADGEEEAVTCTIHSMRPDQASIIRAGHRLNGVTFTHFPDWETGRDCRVIRRTLIDQAEGLYAMELDLLPIGPPLVAGSCTTAVAGAEQTADIAMTSTFGPVSIPVDAASFNSAQQITVWVYSGPLLGLGGTSIVVGGSGWTELDQYDALGSHTWIGVGYNYQPTIATPANMTVTATSSGGGLSEAFGVAVAFPTSSSSPVQQSVIEVSGNPDLPDPPTPGNILFVWAVGETSALESTGFVADGGVMLVENHYEGGNLGVGGVYVSIGMRCVQEGETGINIEVPGNSHSHWASVSEWAP